MSSGFATWQDLQASQDVHGVTWEVLQHRCSPGAGAGQTQGGWISDGRPIKEVLRDDWDAVRNLNATHLEIVAHLDAIWMQADPCGFENPKREIEYDARSLPGNSLAAAGPVSLTLSCLRERGIQQDLLDPYNFMKGWNVQWTVKSNGLQVLIGGRNSSAGVLAYAKLFGFYEGGADNPYRVSPARVAAILAGGVAGEPTAARDLDMAIPLSLTSQQRQRGEQEAQKEDQNAGLLVCGSVSVCLAVFGLWYAVMGGRTERTDADKESQRCQRSATFNRRASFEDSERAVAAAHETPQLGVPLVKSAPARPVYGMDKGAAGNPYIAVSQASPQQPTPEVHAAVVASAPYRVGQAVLLRPGAPTTLAVGQPTAPLAQKGQ